MKTFHAMPTAGHDGAAQQRQTEVGVARAHSCPQQCWNENVGGIGWQVGADDNTLRKFYAKDNPGGMREPPAVRQSQRDCVVQPRVARNELPWVPGRVAFNPNGVAPPLCCRAVTPLGLFAFGHVSQGSSFLATLGFESESLWDSSLKFPKGVRANDIAAVRNVRAPGAAFTLVEMIAVLAIIAVLVGAVAPTVIRRMDRATWTKETVDLNSIADSLTQSILRNKTIPSYTNWASAVASQMSLP